MAGSSPGMQRMVLPFRPSQRHPSRLQSESSGYWLRSWYVRHGSGRLLICPTRIRRVLLRLVPGLACSSVGSGSGPGTTLELPLRPSRRRPVRFRASGAQFRSRSVARGPGRLPLCPTRDFPHHGPAPAQARSG